MKRRTYKDWIRDTFTAAKAILTGTDVSPERLEKRLEICGNCAKVEIAEDSKMSCGICGCELKDRGLVNLARYEENLPEWGCKFPTGSKWKEAGV